MLTGDDLTNILSRSISQHRGIELGKKTAEAEDKKKSNHVTRKLRDRNAGHKLDEHVAHQFDAGRLLACISSRPGQVCDRTTCSVWTRAIAAPP